MMKKTKKTTKRKSFAIPDDPATQKWINEQNDLGTSIQLLVADAIANYGEGDAVQAYIRSTHEGVRQLRQADDLAPLEGLRVPMPGSDQAVTEAVTPAASDESDVELEAESEDIVEDKAAANTPPEDEATAESDPPDDAEDEQTPLDALFGTDSQLKGERR